MKKILNFLRGAIIGGSMILSLGPSVVRASGFDFFNNDKYL